MLTIELIELLKTYDGKYKQAEIDLLLDRKEEAIPLFINVLETVLTEIEGYTDPQKDYWDHIYAFYYLGSLCIETAHDIIIDIFSLPNELPDDLFGDSVTEDLPSVLLRTCGGDVTKIKSLIENKDAYIFSRSAAVDALAYAMLDGFICREELLEYYRGLLVDKPNVEDENSMTFYNSMVCSICDIYPEELMDFIKDGFDKGYIDSSYVSYKFFLDTLDRGKEDTLSKLEERLRTRQYRLDDIHHLKNWACFNEGDIENEMAFISQLVNQNLPSKVMPKKTAKQTKAKKKQTKASKKANRKKKK